MPGAVAGKLNYAVSSGKPPTCTCAAMAAIKDTTSKCVGSNAVYTGSCTVSCNGANPPVSAVFTCLPAGAGKQPTYQGAALVCPVPKCGVLTVASDLKTTCTNVALNGKCTISCAAEAAAAVTPQQVTCTKTGTALNYVKAGTAPVCSCAVKPPAGRYACACVCVCVCVCVCLVSPS